MALEDKFLTVRVEPDLHEALRLLAERNDRTMAAEARIAIRERLVAAGLFEADERDAA